MFDIFYINIILKISLMLFYISKNLEFSKPISIKSRSKVYSALNLMQSNKISILPVIDDFGLLIGSIKLSQCI